MDGNFSVCLNGVGGASVTFSFPASMDKEEARSLFDAVLPAISREIVTPVFSAVAAAPAAQAAEEQQQNPLVPEGWPERGTVTLAEITKLWRIGRSTFLRKVQTGVYPKPLNTGTNANMWNPVEVKDAILLEREVKKSVEERGHWRKSRKEQGR